MRRRADDGARIQTVRVCPSSHAQPKPVRVLNVEHCLDPRVFHGRLPTHGAQLRRAPNAAGESQRAGGDSHRCHGGVGPTRGYIRFTAIGQATVQPGVPSCPPFLVADCVEHDDSPPRRTTAFTCRGGCKERRLPNLIDLPPAIVASTRRSRDAAPVLPERSPLQLLGSLC